MQKTRSLDAHWGDFLSAGECIKIGGWPSWVQQAETDRPLFMQITSEGPFDFLHGQGGVIYVFATDNHDFLTISQFD
jgi:hypothetical protein